VQRLTADIVVLVPIYNDWESATILMNHLEEALGGRRESVQVLFVNDGSPTDPPPGFLAQAPRKLLAPRMLDLRRNLGNQRALAISMAWLHRHADFRTLVVMDGDGEDAPADVPRLLDLYAAEKGRTMVFAERARRTDSLVFKAFYHLYRLAHVLLTGHWYNVGNFSVIPADAVERLVVTPELWNHYPAAALKTKLHVSYVPISRAKRYTGTSSMNFASLATHGLAALSTYGEIIGVRLLMASLAMVALIATSLVAALILRLEPHGAAPAWTGYLSGSLIVALLQMVVLSILFVLIILAGRQASPFIPIRDYEYFVRGLRDASTTTPA
jgi:hypothetical protein